MPKIAIITLCVGPDYTRAMEPLLESKRVYAKKHGYDFLIGDKDVWDRHRPAPWSKFNMIQKHLDDYDFLFWSDADAIIVNHDITLESIIALLPLHKDILWTTDACNNLNNGHMIIRGKSTWARDYFNRAYSQNDLVHHIWWDNAAMIRLYQNNPLDYAKIETCTDHWLFNAYVFGPRETASEPLIRLYKRGDFLVHFAGVYDPLNIYRMAKYLQMCAEAQKDHDPHLLDRWRMNAPLNKQDADISLAA
jgi:hypothetical protein